jgi:hypothetical protein
MAECKPRRAARPKRGDEMAQLRKENDELRERLGMPSTDLETWEAMPIEWRDQMAARALVAEWLDARRALIRLGFGDLRTEVWKPLVKIIFETDGVRANLARNLADIEANKQAFLQRTAQIALHSADEATSIRASELLARVGGWAPKEAPPQTQVHVSLYGLIGAGDEQRGPKKVDPLESAVLEGDPMAIFRHTPGAAIRIDSGDEAIEAAIEREALA